MKKSTWIFSLGILCIIGGQIIASFSKNMFALPAGFLAIFVGAYIGKKGARTYNIENGRDADYKAPRNNAQNKRTYIIVGCAAFVAIALIINNYL